MNDLCFSLSSFHTSIRCVFSSPGSCATVLTRQSVSLPHMFSSVSPSSIALMMKAEGVILPVFEVVDAVETIVLMSSDKCPLIARWIHAGYFRDIPSSVATATNSWDMPLNKARPALVPHQRVDFIPLTLLPEGTCIFYQRRLTTSHCALLAGEGEMVVARNVIPLTVLMPYHHYTVLTRSEEAVRLVGPPVFILHRPAISPAEVAVKHLIIQADPLVVLSKTVDKLLLLM